MNQEGDIWKSLNDQIQKYGFIEEVDTKINFKTEIERLKKEKNAVILAHFYQIPEIQDIADFIGDSLLLSQKAAATDADLIVFCGVHFMAETAKLIAPEKKVILPDMFAGCSLADSCPKDDFEKFIKKYPGHTVVSYINSSAALKTLSDIICTSSNAVDIVESIPKDTPIIFAPDRNLGAWVMEQTGREMVIWDGACEVHDLLKIEHILELKNQNPDALLIAHPECKAIILEVASFVGSTNALLNFVKKSDSKKFIVATETGIIHQMKKYNPEKEFIVVPFDKTCSCNDCPFMKQNTLQKLYTCMKYEKPEIVLDLEIIQKARKPIMRMLEISK